MLSDEKYARFIYKYCKAGMIVPYVYRGPYQDGYDYGVPNEEHFQNLPLGINFEYFWAQLFTSLTPDLRQDI